MLDHGTIVAAGPPAALKADHGGERIAVTLPDPGQLGPAAEALERSTQGGVDIDHEQAVVTAAATSATRLIDVVRLLDESGVEATDVHRREATLDDVFLSMTRPTTKEEAIPR